MKILLIGCGSMGGSLLRGWLRKGLPYAFSVATPHWESVKAIDPSLPWYGNPSQIPDDFDGIVLGVQPKILVDVLRDYHRVFEAHPLVITMVAGRTLATYYGQLPLDTPVVRIMPNVAVADGEGMTFLCTQAHLNPLQRQMVADLTQAVGESVWLSESLMNAATALASCGPGFIFELVHQLSLAGVALGLPEDVAALSARQMVIGAGAHLKQIDVPAQELVSRVGHQGSMTEAGVAVLRDHEVLYDLFLRALRASQSKGEEL